MRSREVGSGHAGALKDLETHARNLTDAPGLIREGIAHLEEVATSLAEDIEHENAEGEAILTTIAEESQNEIREYVADVEKKMGPLTIEAATLEGKLRKAGIILTAPIEPVATQREPEETLRLLDEGARPRRR